MEFVVNILGTLVMLAFGALCVFGFLFSITGIVNSIKKEKKRKGSSISLKNLSTNNCRMVEENQIQLSNFGTTIKIAKDKENEPNIQIIESEQICKKTDSLNDEKNEQCDTQFMQDTEIIEVHDNKEEITHIVSLKTTEDDSNEENNNIDDVVICCTFLPEYLKMLEYYKEETFFKMQNTGANPCEIEKPIQINRSFENEQMYM